MTVQEILDMFPDGNSRGPVTLSDLRHFLVRFGDDYVAPGEGSGSGSGSTSGSGS